MALLRAINVSGTRMVPTARLRELMPAEFAFVDAELSSWSPEGVHASKFTQRFLKRRLGVAVATARNGNTVLKLRELATATTAPGS